MHISRHRFFALITGVLVCLAGQPAVAGLPQPNDDALTVRIENPLPIARADEVVALDWAELQGQLAGLDDGNVRVRDAASGQEVMTQPIDNDADGATDELLLLVSLWPHETRDFYIEAAPSTLVPTPRVHVRHDEERDDMAWESDRIAYRTYGQGLWQASAYDPLVSSGIDVWPKRVRDLIIERWYAKGHDAYHQDTGEGADFYSVGTSLGAGGTAIWQDETMYRAENFKTHRILAEGPIRVIFEMDYEPWEAGGINVSQVKRITMDAGQHLFREESTFSSPNADALTYVIGTVKREEGLVGSTSRAYSWAWLSTWGPVERKAGGHGDLGTAVLLARDHLLEMRELDDHYVAVATATPGTPVVHYVGAGWTASGDFETVEDWWAYLNTFALRLETPLRVSIVSTDAQ